MTPWRWPGFATLLRAELRNLHGGTAPEVINCFATITQAALKPGARCEVQGAYRARDRGCSASPRLHHLHAKAAGERDVTQEKHPEALALAISTGARLAAMCVSHRLGAATQFLDAGAFDAKSQSRNRGHHNVYREHASL